MRGESIPLPTSALYVSSVRREVAQLVERVGRVRDQLAEKDLRMRVEGVNDQLQQLGDFSLKLLLGHIT